MDSAPTMAFTAHQVSRLTGLSPQRLARWDREGFFRPELLDEPGVSFGRIYSFRDVVGLRTIAQLRESVSMQHLRRLGDWLREHLIEHEAPWSTLRFWVCGREVLFSDPDSGKPVSGSPPGQMAFEVVVGAVADEVAEEIARLRERPRDQVGQITKSRNVLGNAPAVAGTRIPTAAIWDFHEAGYSVTAIRREYPELRRADVQAALRYERGRQSRRKVA